VFDYANAILIAKITGLKMYTCEGMSLSVIIGKGFG